MVEAMMRRWGDGGPERLRWRLVARDLSHPDEGREGAWQLLSGAAGPLGPESNDFSLHSGRGWERGRRGGWSTEASFHELSQDGVGGGGGGR
jgi:hypothetical protein